MNKTQKCIVQQAAVCGYGNHENRVPQKIGTIGEKADKIVGGDYGVERKSVIDGLHDEPILEKQLGDIAGGVFVVFVKRIDPDERGGCVGCSLESLKQVRDDLVDAVFRHFTEGIVDGQQVQMIRRHGLPLRVDAGYRERQIDVVGLAFITIQPRAVHPPRVVEIKAEQIAVGIVFVGGQFRDVRQVARQFQPEIAVDCRPGRVRRGQNVEIARVDFFKIDRVGRKIDSGSQVGAARLDGQVKFAAEQAPEIENASLGFFDFFGIKGFAVESRAIDVPGLGSEAESVREPQIVKPQIGQKPLRLFSEKRAERRVIRDSVGIGGVCVGIGIERRITTDHAFLTHGGADADFAVAVVFKVGFGEFGAGVEGLADEDRLARRFGSDPFQGGNQTF